MSLRNRAQKKQISSEEVAALQELNYKKAVLQNSGLTPDQVRRSMLAEETVFTVKDTGAVRRGQPVSDNFKKVSDLDPSHGVVIHNPVTGQNECIISRDNKLLTMDGSLHPATVRLMKKLGL